MGFREPGASSITIPHAQGVLHNQEERRADEFAAAVLAPSPEACATIFDICERYGVSERLAEKAMKLYSPCRDGKN